MHRFSSFKRELYHSRVRSVARRMGVGRALRIAGSLAGLGHRLRFRARPCRYHRIELDGLSAAFHVSCGDERARVASYGGERRLLARLIACARAGDVVYDVGANIGLYTVFLAKAVGPKGAVIGFEPERRACGRALANLELNALGNAKMFAVALGAERISVQLSVDPSGSGTTCIAPHLRAAGARHQQAADMVSGDEYIQEHGLPTPAIVKVDVEGFEYEALLGLSRALRHPVCRLVACEVHFATLARMGRSDTPRKIEALLAEFGFDHLEWIDSSHVVAIKTGSGDEQCACAR